MPNTVANVVAGLPLSTGGALRAPLGTALPTDVAASLNVAFKALGYIGDDGVKMAPSRSTSKVKAWGGDVVKVLQTEYSETWKFTMIEALNIEAQKCAFGDLNVTSVGPAAPLAAPVATLGSASAGGTFAAGTYFWKITALNAFGETIGSNELTATLTLNQQQVLNWGAVAGATGYKVYRGTSAGAENVLVTTLGAVATYTDTGTAGTAGTVPTSNTTGAGTRLSIKHNGDILPNSAYVFEVREGITKRRVVLGNAQVTEVGEISYNDGSVIAYPVTLEAFEDSSGTNSYEYTDNGITS